MKKIIFISLISLIVFSCASGNVNSASKKIDVKYAERVLHEGTRSEARIGYVIIGGYKIIKSFNYIIADENEYYYVIKNSPFGKLGYQLSDKKKNIIESEKTFSNSDEANGFYLSNEKFKKTPSHWIYVEWEVGSAFIDGTRMKEVMMKKPFVDIKPRKDFRKIKIRNKI